MALKINKQTIDKSAVVDRGIFFEVLEAPTQKQVELYVRVDKVYATKTTATAMVSFCNFETKDNLFGSSYEFAVLLDGQNFIKQAYQHIKTLPEFSGSQDC